MAATVAAVPVQNFAHGTEDALLARRWFGRAAWCLAIGVGVWFINRSEYPAASVRVLAVFALIAAACCAVAWRNLEASRKGQSELRERLLDALALKGDEKILEIGCGAGLLAIAAAKRLKTGKVTGVDSWDAETAAAALNAARANAKQEGVADRVRFDSIADWGRLSKLVYPENQFDSVVSRQYLHQLLDHVERAHALREMLRVTKPGGRIVIFDSGDTGFYGQLLREAGAKDVTLSSWSFPGCVPHRSVTATK